MRKLLLIVLLKLLFSCSGGNIEPAYADISAKESSSPDQEKGPNDFASRISDAALDLTKDFVRYDPSYYKIPYPNGDVPAGLGVCTDVVIRTFRKVGIDLQKEVHEDMASNRKLYPRIWAAGTDKNIDHRRVPNLMVYFERHWIVKGISDDPGSYVPGDIVCWRLESGQTHIGVVVDRLSPDRIRYMIVHNIGAGQVLEDCLFRYKVIGHYAAK